MQLAWDMLKVLFFPGTLFMAACGLLFLLLEKGFARLAGGGERRLRLPLGGGAPSALAPGDAPIALLSAASMGVAGVLLVWVEGDLVSLALLLSVPSVLPVMSAAHGDSESVARVPLLFREAFLRLLAPACAAVAVGLRYPGEFAPGLESFLAEGIFGAALAWKGVGHALVLSAQACAAAALFVFLLGRPPLAALARRNGEDAAVSALAAVAEGAERSVAMLFFAIVCLGYPWEGAAGIACWAAASLGTAVASTAARAWLEGRNAVFRHRVLRAAFLPAALSLALAVAAALYGGR